MSKMVLDNLWRRFELKSEAGSRAKLTMVLILLVTALAVASCFFLRMASIKEEPTKATTISTELSNTPESALGDEYGTE